MATLRIYADFNERTAEGWCYCLRVNGRELNEIAAELGIYEGMPVVIFCEDHAEEFEFDATLSFRQSPPLSDAQWVAIVSERTLRRLREPAVQNTREQNER